MNTKLFGLIAGMGILAGGVAVVSNLGGKGDDISVGDASIGVEQTVVEAQVVDRGVRTSKGDIVHVVGVTVDKTATVEDTTIGRAVIVPEVTPNTLCTLVFEAKSKKQEVIEHGVKIYGKDIPDMPEPYASCIKNSQMRPEKIMGSEDKTAGTWYWYSLFSGSCCLDMPNWDMGTKTIGKGYMGNSMQEFLTLADAQKKRFLKTYGQCSTDGGTYRCPVNYGDPRADPSEEIFFPMSLADRKDLNFTRRDRYGVVEKRYTIPDGGFAAPVAEPVTEPTEGTK